MHVTLVKPTETTTEHTYAYVKKNEGVYQPVGNEWKGCYLISLFAVGILYVEHGVLEKACWLVWKDSKFIKLNNLSVTLEIK